MCADTVRIYLFNFPLPRGEVLERASMYMYNAHGMEIDVMHRKMADSEGGAREEIMRKA